MDLKTSPDDLYKMGRETVAVNSESDLDNALMEMEIQETPEAPTEATEVAEDKPVAPDPTPNIDFPGKLPEYLKDNGDGTISRTDEEWEGFTYFKDDADIDMGDRILKSTQNDLIRLKNLGVGGIVRSILSPFSSFGNASLAPLTGEEGGTFGQSAKAFVQSFQFQDSLNETAQRDLGQEVVDNVFGGEVPEGLANASVKTLVSLLSDPSVLVGTSAMKIAERGLRENLLATNISGPWKAGIDEFLGKAAIPSAQARQLKEFAIKADQGDKEALTSLSDVLADPDVVQSIKRVEEQEAKELVRNITGDVQRPVVEVVKKNEDNTTPLNTNLNASEVKFNLSAYNTEGDLDVIVENLGSFYKDEYRRLIPKGGNKKVIDDSQLLQLSDVIGKKVTEYSPEEAYALRHMMISASQLAKDSISAYKADPLQGDERFLAVTKSLTLLKSLMAKTTRLETHAGRLLNVQRAHAESSRTSVAQLKEAIGDLKADPTLSDENLELLAQATPEEIAKMSKDIFKPKVSDYFHEVFTNAILSGPQTHAINITSNASNLILRPTEKVLAGMSAAARRDMGEARNQFGQAYEMTSALLGSLGDVVRIVGRLTDRNELLPNHLINNHEIAAAHYRPKITSENLGGQDGPLSSFIDIMGNGVRFFGNSLVTQDQIFKMINYRMSLNAEAVNRATRKAGDPEEFAALKNEFKNNPDIEDIRTAVDNAEYYTFTNQLGKAGTATKVAIKAVPGGRWVLPFFQTPTNIVKFGVRHSVVGNVFKDLKHIKDAGPKGDLARAKFAVGTMMPVAFIGAMGDNITGHIDQSTPAGRFKAQTTPPFSIKMGDKWVSYENIEPARSILGMMVGFRDAIDHLDPETDQDMISELTTTVMAPFLQITTENWMMPQISDTLRILDASRSGNTDQGLQKLQRLSAAMVVPNLFAQSNRAFDKTLRDADSYMEILKSRIPGLSKDIPAYKDLWGDDLQIPPGLGPDMVSPFPVRNKSDKVSFELTRLDDAGGLVDLPGLRREINGIQLTNVQKARFQEIRGKGDPEIGLPPLKKAIESVMKTPEYKNGTDTLKGHLVTYQINTYSEFAKGKLIQEDKQLLEDIQGLKRQKAEAFLQ